MKKSKCIWNLKSTDMGYAIECSNCKHKIGAKDAIIAENKFDICPFCKSEMDLAEFDYDKLFMVANSGHKDIGI